MSQHSAVHLQVNKCQLFKASGDQHTLLFFYYYIVLWLMSDLAKSGQLVKYLMQSSWPLFFVSYRMLSHPVSWHLLCRKTPTYHELINCQVDREQVVLLNCNMLIFGA